MIKCGRYCNAYSLYISDRCKHFFMSSIATDPSNCKVFTKIFQLYKNRFRVAMRDAEKSRCPRKTQA